ncbi:GNAT family N-acetyltransferase [Tellurirhabdus rosea]|uniref:GNAT family N-acetyltransferase n=1 Tax=Tellurirhabdus rosea TaxID=2674997 RepID=UPI00225081A6|nr:GNAT family N-acetyltransferase [Tellurirhabdus rosea]
MNIRAHTAADAASILHLLRLNTPRYFAPEEEQDLTEYLERHTDQYFVLEKEGEILGCGGFNRMDDGETVRISWDIIHPDHHGKGLGRRLTEFRIQRIREIAPERRLVVRTSQHVYRFYERLGFRLKEVVKDYWAEGFDLYHMELEDFVEK